MRETGLVERPVRPGRPAAARRPGPRPIDGVAAVLAPVAARLDAGAVAPRTFTIRFWDGSELPAPAGAHPPTVIVRHRAALKRLLRAPNELGLGRAWVAGELDVEGDVEDTLRQAQAWRPASLQPRDLAAAARAVRRLGLLRGGAPPVPAAEARVTGRLHSRGRDRVAVTHHYDVSNAFYRMVLGPSMVYSCAVFATPEESVDAAQERKLDRICRKLALTSDMRLLDVGCGWGSLVLHAARHYGVRAVGVTLSEPQAALARERIVQAGLADRCEIRVQDYRDVSDGPYDAISSVGMFEHVGEAQLSAYFGRLHGLLAPGGRLLNHGIVRTRPRAFGPDSFVMRYVFPDGDLQTLGHVTTTMEDAGWEIVDDESLRPHYAQTLRAWCANLERNRAAAIAEVGAERERVWRLYMAGSAIGFARGDLSVHQVLARRLGPDEPTPPVGVRSFG